MTIVEHICERKYFYWATWEGWMNLFLLSYPKYINTSSYNHPNHHHHFNHKYTLVVILWPCRVVHFVLIILNINNISII